MVAESFVGLTEPRQGQARQAAIRRSDDGVEVDAQLVLVAAGDEIGELLPVVGERADRDGEGRRTVAPEPEQLLDVSQDAIEAGVDPDALVRGSRRTVDREDEVTAEGLEDASHAIGEDRPVGRDGDLDLGIQGRHPIPERIVSPNQERFPAQEVRRAEVRDELLELVDERGAVGALEPGQPIPVSADGRRPLAVAHHALQVARVGDLEVHHARPLRVPVRCPVGSGSPSVVTSHQRAGEVLAADLVEAHLAAHGLLAAEEGFPELPSEDSVPDRADALVGVGPQRVGPVVAADLDLPGLLEVERREGRVAENGPVDAGFAGVLVGLDRLDGKHADRGLRCPPPIRSRCARRGDRWGV